MNEEYIQEPQNQNGPDAYGTYQTGSVSPPKNKNGLIAFLLIAVILLLGAVTILGAINIKMFRKLNGSITEETLGFVQEKEDSPDPGLTDDPDLTQQEQNQKEDPIQIAPSPTSSENLTSLDGMSLQEIYSKTIDSVVSITCSYDGGGSTGTGVILSEEGYIVTNSHVVEGARHIQVRLQDDRVLTAVLVGADAVSDLAVLQVEAENLVSAELGDSSVLRVGDAVVAIGDPLGSELRGTMTDGIVSAINRDVNVGGRVMNLIQTNAALNSGNSGGPLINCYGQVVGINTMKMGDSMSIAGVEGLGFAIPSNVVGDIVNQLITQGYVSGRPTLGITGENVASFYQFYYGLPYGLYITHVEEDSAADEVGLEPGDILLTMNEIRITGVSDYETVLYGLDPGDALEIVIYRDGRQYSATLTVDEATN